MGRYEAVNVEAGTGVAAVDRALTIAASLEARAAPMTLAELAADTGLYKSTLLRLLGSLERSGLVMRRSDQRYSLGQFAFRLGRAYEATYHLKECVLPLLEGLVEQGTESASFHVWNDTATRLCLFRVDSKHATLDRVRAGDVLPLRRGAAGKILRAFRNGMPDGVGASLVMASFGERDPQCAAVAAPVFDGSGQLAGAISLSGPLERFSPENVKRMTRPLLNAAERATRALGGVWPDE